METKPLNLSAQQAVLTDDEILHLASLLGIGTLPVLSGSFQSQIPEGERLTQFARAIESALLSKLRAPVADERAACLQHFCLAFEAFSRASDSGEAYAELERAYEKARAALASAPAQCNHQFHFFGDQKARRCNRCNVLESKASAPVAGEAQITNTEAADFADKHGMYYDMDQEIAGDHARALLARYAAPQASDAARDAGITASEDVELPPYPSIGFKDPAHGYRLMHQWGVKAVMADRQQRAALSAQPGAQKYGGSDE